MAGYFFVTVPTTSLTWTVAATGNVYPPYIEYGTIEVSFNTISLDAGLGPEFVETLTPTLEATGLTGWVGDTGIYGEMTFIISNFTLESEGYANHFGTAELEIYPLYDFDLVATGLNGMVISGELDLPPPEITLGGVGSSGEAGTGALVAEIDLFTLAVSIDEPMTFTEISLEASGATGWPGVFSENLSITISATGYGYQYGTLDVTITGISLSATGHDNVMGIAELVMPMWSVSASGITGESGYLAETTSFATISAAGYTQSLPGDIDVDFPTITLEASGYVPGSLQPATATSTYVVNTNNFAVTEYSNYNFNSFCYFNGVYIGARSGGLYRIDQDADAGTFIPLTIDKTRISLDTSQIKKATDAYFAVEDSGEMTFEMKADEISFPYFLRNGHAGLRNIKLSLGKGIKGQYLGFTIRNVRGHDLRLSHIKMIVETTQRRIRSASYV